MLDCVVKVKESIVNLLGNLLPSWLLLRLRPSCSSSRRPKLARMALRAENLGEARAICLDIMAPEEGSERP